MINKLTSFFSRLFFAAALIVLVVAVIDWFLRLFGMTLSFISYQPGRLFEFSAILLIFVTVLLLRQIREKLSKSA